MDMAQKGDAKMKILSEDMKWHKTKHVTVERTVEVPQSVVKKRTKTVKKPQIVERFVEQVEYIHKEVEVQLPKTYKTKEVIIEVPQVVIEERIIENEVKVIQERLIEVPKPQFKEIFEYDDRVEYREVPVDKIIEVPEIEYRIREVPYYIPQEYVQEYFVDKYVEVPQVEMQDVYREEQVLLPAEEKIREVMIPQVQEAPSPPVPPPMVYTAPPSPPVPPPMVYKAPPVVYSAPTVRVVQPPSPRPVQVAQTVQPVEMEVVPVKSVRMVPVETVEYHTRVRSPRSAYANYDPNAAFHSMPTMPAPAPHLPQASTFVAPLAQSGMHTPPMSPYAGVPLTGSLPVPGTFGGNPYAVPGACAVPQMSGQVY